MFFRRLNLILLLIVISLSLGIFWYYRRAHPRYAPPSPRKEIDVTIIPGWNLRQIAADWVKKGLIKSPEELYQMVGQPAYDYAAFRKTAPDPNFVNDSGQPEFPLLIYKPADISYEGYFFPDTYRVYQDAELTDILRKIFANLEKKAAPEWRVDENNKGRDFHEILTLASIVEKEARGQEDMALVADIFWRRLDRRWALQSCATVNYLAGKNAPAISAADKKIDSSYNTYKYPGLPRGPISNPGLNTIRAVIHPAPNDYWYFMTGTDGKTRYARTLEEQNANVAKYLR